MLWQQLNQTVELGWDFYAPVILFVSLIIVAVPVWAAIGAAAILMLAMSGDMPLSAVGESLFTGIDAFALTAVPLFILTGERAGAHRIEPQVPRRGGSAHAVRQGRLRLGYRAGLRHVCGGFPARTPPAPRPSGRMTIARLVESGYPRPYACALVAAGACTGILIPPSIAYIIIGLVLGISASTLFLAAVIPGVAILLSILITNIVVNRIHGYESGGNISMASIFPISARRSNPAGTPSSCRASFSTASSRAG